MTDFWQKSAVAAKSAAKLFDEGDLDGAINRAYYSIFSAARFALSQKHPGLDTSKTHAGLMRQFGREIIQKDGLDAELGRILSRVEDLRYEADYENIQLTTAAVEHVLNDMTLFRAAIAKHTGQDTTP
jgi:uncharacterized protein (UPF0332 family)